MKQGLLSRAMRPLSEIDLQPTVATVADIEELNRVFADAFTDRYRRDGMVGVRVPQLNPLIWQYAIDDAGDGALVWRDSDGAIAGFNIAHRSGREGWMGPLAVRPDLQGRGLGQVVVRTAMDWLRARGVDTLGLETMPRTIDNIGFYSRLGFDPGSLTLTMARDLPRLGRRRVQTETARGYTGLEEAVVRCRDTLAAVAPTYDFTREIDITTALRAGDLCVLDEGEQLTGFALWHSAPLAMQRTKDELRVLKAFARDTASFRRLVHRLEAVAYTEGVRRVVYRAQTRFMEAYRVLIEAGYCVRWSDLRMAHGDHAEPNLGPAIVYSNWEI